VLIAHLSDPHLTTGALSAEPVWGLYRALARVQALDPQPDCTVITGDLADHGRADEYELLREVIDRFPLPLHLVMGNHDDPEAFLDAFAGSPYLGDAAQSHYSVDYPAATIVVLDSRQEGTAAGLLGADQLGWLDDVLARRPDVPAFVCLHHPPIPVGMVALDPIRLLNGDAMAEVISRHSNVERVLAGHLHRTVSAAFAGTLLTVAPSTYRQADLVLNPERRHGFAIDPTGFLLHLSTGAATDPWITHSVPVSPAGVPSGEM
jgi:3',5'-cyclic AMP phosphodiesterase CpdA